LLLDKVKDYHNEYLRKNLVDNFDYEEEESWYKGFKVHEIPKI